MIKNMLSKFIYNYYHYVFINGKKKKVNIIL